MKKHEIFESNPDLKEVHMTSDGQAFFKESDAKNHAKTLKNKTVELILNPTELEVFLEDFDNDQDDDLANDVKTKFIDNSNAGNVLESTDDDDQNEDFDGDDQDDFNQNENHDNAVADFSVEKTDDGIKEPLTEIKAEADGSENILIETQYENINAETNESTEELTSNEEKPAVEKKSNIKKGK